MPPVLFVTLRAEVQSVALFEICMSKSAPYAASHESLTLLRMNGWPRSTAIHSGSLNLLDHRVAGLASTAFEGPNAAESNAMLLAEAGRWAARSVADGDLTRLPYTPNDQSEYPHSFPRRVPKILT